MKIFLIVLLLPIQMHAQRINGKVVDTSGAPLPNASVFISNTSIGTTTNENGEFVINRFPEGAFDLVISYVGYETLVYKISDLKKSSFLFALQPKNNNLQNIIVRSYEKNGWERWGFLFTNNFIGTSALADHCKILNTKDIGFVFSEKKRVLAAYSQKPIIIINKKLGYRIEFDLEKFVYDFESKYLVFEGYPLFKPLDANKSRQKKWDNTREQVYEGSLLNFMRAVYQDRLKETGFVLRHLIRKPNVEKQRVKLVLKSAADKTLIPADSMTYYNRVMHGSDYTDLLYPQPMGFEKFASRTDSNTVMMNFTDCLQVSYLKRKEDPEYHLRNVGIHPDSCITALITMEDRNPIAVTRSGSFYNVTDLTLMGYWAWSEKVAKMLPLDYWP